MSNVAIENKIVMKPISEITPYEKNPRRNAKTVELLCEIIPKVGFNVPLVIDSNGVIVKGHARYKAALALGMTELPCIITHADPEAIKADRIADNKISEFSEWINEELMHEVDMIDFDFDFNKIGISVESFDDIPDIEEFKADDSSEEDKAEKYRAFLERQAEENKVEVQMASEAEIKSAIFKQINIPKAPRNYGKCICKKCGNVMYFDKNVLYGKNGTIRRG